MSAADMEQPTVELKPDPLDLERPADLRQLLEERVEVRMTMRRGDIEKHHAFMHSDEWEKARAVRNQDLQGCLDSLKWCVDIALHADYSTAVSIACFLSSLYNGSRVKADVSRVFNYDGEHFEHLMNVMRLCHETNREPHSFFKKGNAIFERIITRHGLEKRRRKS